MDLTSAATPLLTAALTGHLRGTMLMEVDSAAKLTTRALLGGAALTLAADTASTFADTGAAASTFADTGAAASTFADTGAATSTFADTGAATCRVTGPATGRATLGLLGQGT